MFQPLGLCAACHCCLLQVTALSGYLYKFSKDERRVKLQEALTQFAPPRCAQGLLSVAMLHECCMSVCPVAQLSAENILARLL